MCRPSVDIALARSGGCFEIRPSPAAPRSRRVWRAVRAFAAGVLELSAASLANLPVVAETPSPPSGCRRSLRARAEQAFGNCSQSGLGLGGSTQCGAVFRAPGHRFLRVLASGSNDLSRKHQSDRGAETLTYLQKSTASLADSWNVHRTLSITLDGVGEGCGMLPPRIAHEVPSRPGQSAHTPPPSRGRAVAPSGVPWRVPLAIPRRPLPPSRVAYFLGAVVSGVEQQILWLRLLTPGRLPQNGSRLSTHSSYIAGHRFCADTACRALRPAAVVRQPASRCFASRGGCEVSPEVYPPRLRHSRFVFFGGRLQGGHTTDRASPSFCRPLSP